MKTLKNNRLQKVLNGLKSRNFWFETASEYGEPGYSTDKPLVLLGNWNELNKSELNAVEAVAEIERCEEWLTDDRRRAFRTQPDCYGWEPSFFYHDGDIVPYDSLPDSGEELADALRDYGFAFAPGDETGLRAVPSSITAETLKTFAVLVEDDCKTGFHVGQNDKPADKLKNLPSGDYVFRIGSKGQFDVTWQVWRLID